MSNCLYFTQIKPSRKQSQQLADWLKAHYPECSFTEVNVAKVTHRGVNGGRYQGRVEGPDGWVEVARQPDRQVILDAARRLLAEAGK
jgi:hypothetical protein